jgi:hypothetical protein
VKTYSSFLRAVRRRDLTCHTRLDCYRQRPPTHREPRPRRFQWPGVHTAPGLGGITQAPGTHAHPPRLQDQLPGAHTNCGPGDIGIAALGIGGGIEGACIIVLGDKGEPGIKPGWACAVKIPAASTPTAVRTINSLFLIYPPCVRSFLTNAQSTLTAIYRNRPLPYPPQPDLLAEVGNELQKGKEVKRQVSALSTAPFKLIISRIRVPRRLKPRESSAGSRSTRRIGSFDGSGQRQPNGGVSNQGRSDV